MYHLLLYLEALDLHKYILQGERLHPVGFVCGFIHVAFHLDIVNLVCGLVVRSIKINVKTVVAWKNVQGSDNRPR